MDALSLRTALSDFGCSYFYSESGELALTHALLVDSQVARATGLFLPARHPKNLGEPSFRRDYGLVYAYATGAMANGIASERLVEEISAHGMIGFFGAAGLDVARVARAIATLKASRRAKVYGFNLIHSPQEPNVEHAVSDLYLKEGIRLVEASAYLKITLPLVRYRVVGIRREADGRIVAPNRVIAKASRTEVATQFFSPPPEAMLGELVQRGDISHDQARWARQIPVAQDVTAEADSGGHTDKIGRAHV